MPRLNPLLRTALATAVLIVPAAATAAPAMAADESGVTTIESSYPTDHGSEPMTIYRPPNPRANAPAVVMVHGGGWSGGSRTHLDPPARQAADAGLVVVNIDYDLDAPRFPRERDDAAAAITYIRSHASEFGIDPDRIGGLGTSAGANLLLLAVTTGNTPLQAIVGWSGPYDLTRTAASAIKPWPCMPRRSSSAAPPPRPNATPSPNRARPPTTSPPPVRPPCCSTPNPNWSTPIR
ncbi:alpha/beta hydrolase fold domain-containing protein [Nocardia sp. ET3-3]|uniref:Alpha/beta hydrolase fold domain-containing protein n=1 Tax=Nocardia terrae TaxID=2675851 RepID=A0A7K1USE0_9NOCA|nr:alpha/beta hydrolase [Nocardia terrae]MVU77245.1 alpha/beta hydrolase fold domain-containing protein [Nocardia terrae]